MPTFVRGDSGSSSSSVSEVKPSELARMIEGVNLEDTQKHNVNSKMPNHLKSSMKSSPSNTQRKVQFINERKDHQSHIDLDDPLGDMDLSDFDGTINDEKKLQINMNQCDTKLNIGKPSDTQNLKVTQSISKPFSPIKVNSSGHDIDAGKFLNIDNETASKMESDESPCKPKIISRRTSLQPTLRNKIEDDLFSLDGKHSPKREFSPVRQGARRNSSFMSDLFGNKKADFKADTKCDFILDDKYKQIDSSSVISQNGSKITDVQTSIKNDKTNTDSIEVGSKAVNGRRGRRGTAPTLHSHAESEAASNPNLFNRGGGQAQFSWSNRDGISLEPNVNTFSTSNALSQKNISNISSALGSNEVTSKVMEENNRLMQQQFKRMEGFEIQQQNQFRKDLEDQKKVLEIKQKEYKNAMEQQRSMTQEQILAMQERQSNLLKQQQVQAETMLNQIQSQMESEMRMKSEMMRNQLSVFSEIQTHNPIQPIDISTIIHQTQGNKEMNNKEPTGLGSSDKSIEELRQHYQKKCDRMSEIHAEEIKELKDRNDSLLERSKENREENRKELEMEKERRLRELKRLREEHNQTLEQVKSEYLAAMEKVDIHSCQH